MKKVFTTTVSIKEENKLNILRGLVQYDTLNEVHIRLSDGYRAFDYTGFDNIILKVLKPDGTTYMDSLGENIIAESPEDGVITLMLSGQATAAAGVCQSVIELYSSGEKMTTSRFNYEVFAELEVDEGYIPSAPEYPVLQQLIANISALEDAINAAESERVTAEDGRNDAEAIRVANEEVRISNEQIRVSSEQERDAAEEVREENERQRQSVVSGLVAQAKEYVVASADNAYNAGTYAIKAESWAVGGTGKREGEDTNNAKYYAESAAENYSKSAYNVYLSFQNAQSAEKSATDAQTSADGISEKLYGVPSNPIEFEVAAGESEAYMLFTDDYALPAIIDGMTYRLTVNDVTADVVASGTMISDMGVVITLHGSGTLTVKNNNSYDVTGKFEVMADGARYYADVAGYYANASAESASAASQKASIAESKATAAANSASKADTASTLSAEKAAAAAKSERNAASSAESALESAQTAANKAQIAVGSETTATNAATRANISAGNAETAASNALRYSANAENSATAAATSEENAAASASAASTSEVNASTSEKTASTAAYNASTSATSASSSASAASTSASNAASSASAAATSEVNASVSEKTASTAAANASSSASAASSSASAAEKSASAAADSAEAAAGSASAAATSATSAESSKESAASSAGEAQWYMQQSELYKNAAVSAQNSAVQAKSSSETSASNASASATSASDSATLAESWAIGGTETRDGEDTDNAKYYAEQASASATAANSSAVDSKNSFQATQALADSAGESASIATSKANQAANHASNAYNYANQAANHASNAYNYQVQAGNYYTSAASYANDARNYAYQASTNAAGAASNAAKAESKASAANTFAKEAQAAQEAAESARDEAQAIVGGDFATNESVDTKISNHNTAEDAHQDIRDAIASAGVPVVTAYSDDGAAYTATLAGVTSITSGMEITVIPGKAGTAYAPTLNINGLGAYSINRGVSDAPNTSANGMSADWFKQSRPFHLLFNGSRWIATEFTKPSAKDLDGTVPVSLGGTGSGTTAGARANLGITPDNIGAAKSDMSNVDAETGRTALSAAYNRAYTTAGTGAAYEVTIPGITALEDGMWFVINPHAVSTTTTPTLNVNGIGAKQIMRYSSNSTAQLVEGNISSWISSGRPIIVTVVGDYFVVLSMTRTDTRDLLGTVGVSKGGTGLYSLTAGSYLVGNGAREVQLKTPDEVLADIGAKAASDSDMFIAEYGVTTFDEIQAAVDAGKAVFVKDNDLSRFGLLFNTDGEFTFTDGNEYMWFCYADGTWEIHYFYSMPEGHHNTHASTGSDPITPDMIGAAPASHASDITIHVTAEEKETWNAKASTSYVDEQITAQLGNIATLLAEI